MRFAYIDSNGNEVPIPSVDALALRIELGAITEKTELYDAQADEWGPAHTHEIFHTLSRSTADEDGFIAPPPVASAPVADPPADGRGEDEGTEGRAAAPPSAGEAEAGEDEAAADGKAPKEEPVEDEDTSFGLTLAEAKPPPPDDDETSAGATAGSDLDVAAEPAKAAGPAGGDDATDGDEEEEDDLPYLDLESAAPGTKDDGSLDVGPSSDTPGERSEAVFDFGDMDGDLVAEEALESPDRPMDFAPSSDGGTTDLGGDMDLETAMEFDAADFDSGDDAPLDLETPMSEFKPEEPPSWMDEDEASGGGNVLDFSSVGVGADEEAESEGPVTNRRKTKGRPSPPRHRRQRNMAPALVGIVVVLAVGIGGYVAWPVLSDRLASIGAPDDPEVVIPPLAEELMPVMREASDAVLASIHAEARTEWAASSPASEPPADWLAGIYLATAADYPAVETFWTGIADYVDRLRGVDLTTFDAAVRAELQAAGVSDADLVAVVARADSGFVAAAPERAQLYDRFQRLADAALSLHAFLVANQDNIAYAPAAAVTTDPNMEVAPATEEIADAMNDRLDAYFRAQSDLGVRDKPTATGLMTMLRTSALEVWVR